jgi:hypothetical protein
MTGLLCLVPVVFLASAVGLIGESVYIREFVMSADPFDPMRGASVDCLFYAMFCFIGMGASASVIRILLHGDK